MRLFDAIFKRSKRRRRGGEHDWTQGCGERHFVQGCLATSSVSCDGFEMTMKRNDYKERFEAFMVELIALCRKHGILIIGRDEGAWLSFHDLDDLDDRREFKEYLYTMVTSIVEGTSVPDPAYRGKGEYLHYAPYVHARTEELLRRARGRP